MAAPLIAVVADRKTVTAGPWKSVATDGLPHTYLTAIEQAGGIPFLVPSLEASLAAIQQYLAMADGLFLPGGRDIDAELYGQTAHESNDPPLRIRDVLEIAMVRGARSKGMPIFGACRGMQLINVALGGTLEQHLADRVDMTPHRDVVGVFNGHEVTITPGSKLAQLTTASNFEIASHHHQAVDRLGDGLVVSAFAEDGVVEAIETTDDDFCLGVEWHPEERLDPHGIVLVRAFIEAARARREVSA